MLTNQDNYAGIQWDAPASFGSVTFRIEIQASDGTWIDDTLMMHVELVSISPNDEFGKEAGCSAGIMKGVGNEKALAEHVGSIDKKIDALHKHIKQGIKVTSELADSNLP